MPIDLENLWRVMQADLRPLFAEARRDGLWFYASYHGLWFSPDELAAEQTAGRFRWGPENWELRNPQEFIDEHSKTVRRAERALEYAKDRVYRGGRR